jgi:hypothetical protein
MGPFNNHIHPSVFQIFGLLNYSVQRTTHFIRKTTTLRPRKGCSCLSKIHAKIRSDPCDYKYLICGFNC